MASTRVAIGPQAISVLIASIEETMLLNEVILPYLGDDIEQLPDSESVYGRFLSPVTSICLM